MSSSVHHSLLHLLASIALRGMQPVLCVDVPEVLQGILDGCFVLREGVCTEAVGLTGMCSVLREGRLY